MALKNLLKKFFSLHLPEQLWVIRHIFIAKKVLLLSEKAKNIANSYIDDKDLDGDYSGGMVDAFRHCLWMALITKHFNEKVARSLGIAYEKGNKIDFKKKILEEKYLPDAISSKMDLLNNEIGIKLGNQYKNLSDKQLEKIVKQAVLDGLCWKIKKNKKQQFLNAYNEKIPPSQWMGKWITPKVLVPSDFFVEL